MRRFAGASIDSGQVADLGHLFTVPPADYIWVQAMHFRGNRKRRSKSMRLTPSEVDAILTCARRHFGERTVVRKRRGDESRTG
jgi:hypothetical protein